LRLKAGTYSVTVASGSGNYTFPNVNGGLPTTGTQNVALTDGQVMTFGDLLTFTAVGEVATTVITVDGVPITFNVTAIANPTP